MRRVALLLCVLPVPLLPAAEPAPVTAIRAGRLLDVAAERVREDVVIVVEGDHVREVGTTVPAGATVIDLPLTRSCRE
jgi:imidazolonepropionase-like amidohydrolase